MSELYPLYVKLENKKCLVVGGGKVAARKIDRLLRAGARVVVVSPDLVIELQELLRDNRVQHISRKFQANDLENVFLVIAATNDDEVNKRVSEEAIKRNILVNVVDVPEYCNFYVPSVYQQGDLMIAISTNGKSPALAKMIREKLEIIIPGEIAAELERLGYLRKQKKSELSDEPENRERLAKEMAKRIIDSYFE